MLQKYTIHQIPNHADTLLCTMLSYECRLSMLLKKHEFKDPGITHLLLDTALKGNGNNEYRFVMLSLDEEGRPDFDVYSYVDPDPETRRFADQVLQSFPEAVKASPLTESCVSLLLNTGVL